MHRWDSTSIVPDSVTGVTAADHYSQYRLAGIANRKARQSSPTFFVGFRRQPESRSRFRKWMTTPRDAAVAPIVSRASMSIIVSFSIHVIVGLGIAG